MRLASNQREIGVAVHKIGRKRGVGWPRKYHYQKGKGALSMDHFLRKVFRSLHKL